jgi:hypothetical protein
VDRDGVRHVVTRSARWRPPDLWASRPPPFVGKPDIRVGQDRARPDRPPEGGPSGGNPGSGHPEARHHGAASKVRRSALDAFGSGGRLTGLIPGGDCRRLASARMRGCAEHDVPCDLGPRAVRTVVRSRPSDSVPGKLSLAVVPVRQGRVHWPTGRRWGCLFRILEIDARAQGNTGRTMMVARASRRRLFGASPRQRRDRLKPERPAGTGHGPPGPSAPTVVRRHHSIGSTLCLSP